MTKLISAEEYLAPLHECRLLVLLECDVEACPDDNEEPHFHQVKIDEKQFKKVSDAISGSSKKDESLKDGYEMIELHLTGTFDSKQFDGLSSTT